MSHGVSSLMTSTKMLALCISRIDLRYIRESLFRSLTLQPTDQQVPSVEKHWSNGPMFYAFFAQRTQKKGKEAVSILGFLLRNC